MSISNFLKELDDYLFSQCGTTYEAAEHILRGKAGPVGTVFFNPYKSKANFGYRAAHVVTAPLILSFLSLKLLVSSIYMGTRTILDLTKSNRAKAKRHALDSLLHAVCFIIIMVLAIVSPIINSIDLIGSGLSTLKASFDDYQADFF